MPLTTESESVLSRYASVRRHVAAYWFRTYWVQARVRQGWVRYRSVVAFTGLLLSMAGTVYVSPAVQPPQEGWFAEHEAVRGLQSFVLNTGVALIGAAPIVTSLVLFAMQVNIERMPHLPSPPVSARDSLPPAIVHLSAGGESPQPSTEKGKVHFKRIAMPPIVDSSVCI